LELQNLGHVVLAAAGVKADQEKVEAPP